MVRRTLLLISAVACACDPGGTLDASMDASPDGGGGDPVDAAPFFDAGSDAEAPVDATPLDGAVADAEAPDGGFCACEPVECRSASCVSEACIYTIAPDGAPCTPGSERVCLAGACSVGVCGDTFREPGPDPAREGCDDGNLLSGDACAPGCAPSVLVISSRAGEEDLPAAVSVAADDTGNLLLLWAASEGESLYLRVRRLNRFGVAPMGADGAEVTLDGDLGRGFDPHAAVVGLASGWAVVWTARGADASEEGIRYRLVPVDGSAGVVRRANQYEMGRQAAPSIARTTAGFLVAWADESGTATLPGESRLRYRGFDASGRALGDEAALSPDGTSAREAFLARGDADRILAVWTEDALDFFSRPRVVALRLGGAAPDAAPFAVSDVDGAEPHATLLDSGDFAVAWVGRNADPQGDIHTRLVHATGDPLAGTSAIALTSTPPMMLNVAEVAPRITPMGGAEYLVNYEDGGRRRGVSLIQVGSSPLAPELPILQGHLRSGLQGDVSLLRTPRGYWFAWSDAGSLGVPGVLRSFVAYLLPPS